MSKQGADGPQPLFNSMHAEVRNLDSDQQDNPMQY